MFGEDSLSDIIKQRISTPFFANYVISWLLLNKEATLAMVFLDENDKVYGQYCYLKECVYTKIEILPIIFKANLIIKTCPSCNWLWFPLISTLLITAGLPYLKALFNFFNDNSKLFSDWLYKKLNLIEVVSIDRYNSLLNSNRDLNIQNRNLKLESSDFTNKIKESEKYVTQLLEQVNESKKEVQVFVN